MALTAEPDPTLLHTLPQYQMEHCGGGKFCDNRLAEVGQTERAGVHERPETECHISGSFEYVVS